MIGLEQAGEDFELKVTLENKIYHCGHEVFSRKAAFIGHDPGFVRDGPMIVVNINFSQLNLNLPQTWNDEVMVLKRC